MKKYDKLINFATLSSLHRKHFVIVQYSYLTTSTGAWEGGWGRMFHLRVPGPHLRPTILVLHTQFQTEGLKLQSYLGLGKHISVKMTSVKL